MNALDDRGDGKCLSAARNPEQCLGFLPILESFDESIDGLRLVSASRKWAFYFKFHVASVMKNGEDKSMRSAFAIMDFVGRVMIVLGFYATLREFSTTASMSCKRYRSVVKAVSRLFSSCESTA